MENLDQKTPRLLTPEEIAGLEGNGVIVIEDRPEICYLKCDQEKNLKRAMARGTIIITKPAVVLTGKRADGGEEKSDNIPSLEGSINLLIERNRSLGGYIDLEKFKDTPPTDRGVIKNDEDADYDSVFYVIGHWNNILFMKAFLPEDIAFKEVFLLNEPTSSQDEWLKIKMLEHFSSTYLEPRGRSKSFYEEHGLEEDSLRILEDLDFLKEATGARVGKVVEENFSGDWEVFQKSWREFYHDWWPTQFQKMMACQEKVIEWLQTIVKK